MGRSPADALLGQGDEPSEEEEEDGKPKKKKVKRGAKACTAVSAGEASQGGWRADQVPLAQCRKVSLLGVAPGGRPLELLLRSSAASIT